MKKRLAIVSAILAVAAMTACGRPAATDSGARACEMVAAGAWYEPWPDHRYSGQLIAYLQGSGIASLREAGALLATDNAAGRSGHSYYRAKAADELIRAGCASLS